MLTKARRSYLRSTSKDEWYFRLKMDGIKSLIKHAKDKLNHPSKYEEECDKVFTEEEQEGLLAYVNCATRELKMLKRQLPVPLTFMGTNYRCDSCGNLLDIDPAWKYCPVCGHRWGEIR